MQPAIIDTIHISTVVDLSPAQAGPSNLLSLLSTKPISGCKYMYMIICKYMYMIITEADVNIKESS